MAGNKLGVQTKEKILNAALLEFIEKGFNNARVEDIAKRAGLTKVMLYYHFSSKENMMSELMARLSSEIIEKFRKNLSKIDIKDPQSVRSHVEIMLDYFYERKEILRLITSESIKCKNGSVGSFSIFEELFKTISLIIGDNPEVSDNTDTSRQYHFLIRVFFFNMLPMVMYSSLSDKFNDDFGIDKEKSRKAFIDTFINVLYTNLIEQQDRGHTIVSMDNRNMKKA